MALKALLTAEEFGSLSEPLQGEYKKTEVDGKEAYQLDVTPAGGLELGGVTKLQKALNEERESVKKLKQQLTPFRDDTTGELLDPAAARDALQKLEELGDDASVDAKVKAGLEAKEAQLQQKYADQQKQLEQKYTKDLSQRDQTITGMKSQLEKSMIEQAAVAAITEAGGKPKLLLPHVRQSTKLVEVDGKYEVRVVDENGQEQLSRKPNSGTDPMGIAEFVESLRDSEDFDRAFDASGPTGSGAGGGNTGTRSGRGGVIRLTRDESRNPRVYQEAKKQAAESGSRLEITD
jgi:hypothetical protein